MTGDALPDFPFRRVVHNRLAERRGDQDFLDTAWADSATRVVVLQGVDPAASDDGRTLSWIPTATAPPGDRLLLGEADGVVRFAVVTPATDDISTGTPRTHVDGADAPVGLGFLPLRRLAQRLSDVEASFAVHAVALAGWHQRHTCCSVCGCPTEVVRAGESRTCPSCSAQHFPRTDPAVIMTVVDDEGRCLLGHNSARAEGWYSTLAGFVEPGESTEQAVVREVREEVGVEIDRVTYLGSQPWPFPSSLMLGFDAHASSVDIVVDGDEITEARWFTRDELASAVKAGELVLPTTISISGALISRWYGDDLPPNQPTL